MSDKKIPAPAYIIIGAGMILMSFFDIESLSFFVFIGAIFVVIGFFKIIIKIKKDVPQHAGEHPSNHPHAQHHAQTGQHATTHHAQHTHHAAHCPHCNVKLHPLFKYCPNCGHKMK